MHLKQFDIGTTFLNGDLSEEIYVTQPQGYVNPQMPKYYCRLKKSIYGLHQSFSVSRTTPTKSLIAVKRIMRYLKRTKVFGLYYHGQSSPPRLIDYTDADYLGDLDNQKSRTGFVYTLGSIAVAWGSHKQGCFAGSTTNFAELVAMVESTKETVWLCRLLRTLDSTEKLLLTIHSDNQAAIALVKNPEYHKRTKHVDMKYYAIRTYYEDNLLDFNYICTTEQIADTFTKALPEILFKDSGS